MDEFKRIKMSSFLVLLLQFTGAAIGQRSLFLSVRAGDEATLPCNKVTHDQDECDGTTWFFIDSGSAVMLVKDSSDQENNKVQNSWVKLSVVTMTEHQNNDMVTLRCSVGPYRGCVHTVKWLFQGQDVDKDHNDIKTSQSYCSASVAFLTSHLSYTSRSKMFTCAVTTGSNVQTFSIQSSGEDTAAATESDTRSGFNSTTSVITEDSAKLQGLLRLVIVSVGLAALIMIVVAVNIWTRTKEKQKQMDEINVRYDVDDGTVNYENIRPPDGV